LTPLYLSKQTQLDIFGLLMAAIFEGFVDELIQFDFCKQMQM
jgi:hypothetical protein